MAPGDSWLNEYKGVEQNGQDIMEKINQRNQLRNTGGNYSRVQTEARLMLKNFTRDLNNLKQSLLRASSSYHITEKEVERRQNILDKLITREKQLNSAFQQEIGSSDIGRNTLLSGDMRARDPYAPGYDGPDTSDMDIGAMRQQQHQIIAEQDKGLDVLSGIIQRQKMMGHAISDEVDAQNEIIDEITDHADTTNQRLIKETTHVKKVTAKSSTCGMLVVIVLLLIVIVVVAVVPK